MVVLVGRSDLELSSLRTGTFGAMWYIGPGSLKRGGGPGLQAEAGRAGLSREDASIADHVGGEGAPSRVEHEHPHIPQDHAAGG